MTVLSIVTPCYNEEAGIAECYEAVRAVMESELQDFSYEHIFIDNCSQDRTVAILRDIAARDRRVKVIVNSRNFGPARSPFHAVLQNSRGRDNSDAGGSADPAIPYSPDGEAMGGRRKSGHRGEATERRANVLAPRAQRLLQDSEKPLESGADPKFRGIRAL